MVFRINDTNIYLFLHQDHQLFASKQRNRLFYQMRDRGMSVTSPMSMGNERRSGSDVNAHKGWYYIVSFRHLAFSRGQ